MSNGMLSPSYGITLRSFALQTSCPLSPWGRDDIIIACKLGPFTSDSTIPLFYSSSIQNCLDLLMLNLALDNKADEIYERGR